MMDKEEAREVIQAELEAFRAKPYAGLRQMIEDTPITHERVAPSGKRYQVEIQAFWDGEPNGDIRVAGSVDDGGLRAFFPLTEAFIKTPSNELVGE